MFRRKFLKSLQFASTHPVLFGLVAVQLGILVTTLSLVGYRIRLDLLNQEAGLILIAKEQVNRTLAKEGSDWRALAELGLTFALERQLDTAKQNLPIKSIALLQTKETSQQDFLKLKSISDSIIFPSVLDGSEAFFLIQLDTEKVRLKNLTQENPITFVSLMAVGALLSSIVTFIYFYRLIIRPLAAILQALRGNEDARLEAVARVAATGEMSEFRDALIGLYENALRSKTDAAIARTTSGMAHDVKKPFSMLKMVMGLIANAQNGREAQDIAKQSLPEIAQAMTSVEGMIQDVMQIGSDAKPHLEACSPDTVIEAAMNELFRIFPKADVNVTYQLGHTHKLEIDTIRVGRVFSNILVNALQAMDGTGEIWVKTKESDGIIEFRLGNVGSCIHPQSLPKLFDAFFTSDKKGGTGLGLAIAQKVVLEHGGSIRCESQRTQEFSNGYVEFIFTLPCSSEITSNLNSHLPVHSSEVHKQFALMKASNRELESAETTDLEEMNLENSLRQKLDGYAQNSIPTLLIVDDEALYRNSLVSLLRAGDTSLSQLPIVFAKNF